MSAGDSDVMSATDRAPVPSTPRRSGGASGVHGRRSRELEQRTERLNLARRLRQAVRGDERERFKFLIARHKFMSFIIARRYSSPDPEHAPGI